MGEIAVEQGIGPLHVIRTVELLGGAKTQDVYEVSTSTTPGNVYFQFRVPVYLADPGSLRATAEAMSVSIESVLSLTGVVGMEYVQDVNQANLLVDYMLIYVTSSSGESSDYLRWPLASIDLRVVATPVAALIAKLDAFEGR